MKKRILVVEDEKIVVSVIADLLRNYEIIHAIDGIYALKICKMQRPDLVIVDLSLPRMSGDEFMRNMREDEKLQGVPIILISGTFSDKHNGEKLKEYPESDAVFSKPIDFDTFVKTIDSLVSSLQS
ncbi:MAG: hypothetical protein A2293_02500 [Elusimicrobia bacterium RIFOXYB2_FULL_49_7]|nr:MAG: hypothetical protein A2293_02500 [Elusimicrobia bacterium RIFOXYB2_FULL_49_7]